MATRAITRAPLKIHVRARCLHQTEGFRGRAIEWCHSNLHQTDSFCHGNQSLLFEHKSGYYNSASIGYTSKILATNRGFTGSTNLTVLVSHGNKY